MVEPRTPLALRAVEQCERALSPNYFRHSMRAYGLALAYAKRDGLEVDEEGLFVAMMFHDIGFFPGYRDRSRAFQVVSADALREFCEKNGVAPDRRELWATAVEYHMQLRPRWDLSSAAGLVHAGAWTDVLALGRFTFPEEARSLGAQYPRGWFLCEATMNMLRSVGSAGSVLGLWAPRRGR